jgi:hypothetical protein
MMKFVPWGGHWGFVLSSALEYGVVMAILVAQQVQQKHRSR